MRGPVQLTFSRSVEPIIAQEHAITRMAVTNERDAEKERTIGRKYTVPYGLYRGLRLRLAILRRKDRLLRGRFGGALESR